MSRELLARAWAAGPDLATHHSPSTWTPPSARPTDWPRRGRDTMATPAPGAITHCWLSPRAVLARLREGRANTARGGAHFLRETVSRFRYGGARGQLTVRADSGFYTHALVAVCRRLPPSAAGWMSASPSPSASTKACGISSRRYLKMPGRRFLTGWTAPPLWPRPPAEPVSKVSNSASVYTVSRLWERRQEDAASRNGPGADVAVAAVP